MCFFAVAAVTVYPFAVVILDRSRSNVCPMSALGKATFIFAGNSKLPGSCCMETGSGMRVIDCCAKTVVRHSKPNKKMIACFFMVKSS